MLSRIVQRRGLLLTRRWRFGAIWGVVIVAHEALTGSPSQVDGVVGSDGEQRLGEGDIVVVVGVVIRSVV